MEQNIHLLETLGWGLTRYKQSTWLPGGGGGSSKELLLAWKAGLERSREPPDRKPTTWRRPAACLSGRRSCSVLPWGSPRPVSAVANGDWSQLFTVYGVESD